MGLNPADANLTCLSSSSGYRGGESGSREGDRGKSDPGIDTDCLLFREDGRGGGLGVRG